MSNIKNEIAWLQRLAAYQQITITNPQQNKFKNPRNLPLDHPLVEEVLVSFVAMWYKEHHKTVISNNEAYEIVAGVIAGVRQPASFIEYSDYYERKVLKWQHINCYECGSPVRVAHLTYRTIQELIIPPHLAPEGYNHCEASKSHHAYPRDHIFEWEQSIFSDQYAGIFK